jgi:hypothetical protein
MDQRNFYPVAHLEFILCGGHPYRKFPIGQFQLMEIPVKSHLINMKPVVGLLPEYPEAFRPHQQIFF